MENITVDIFTGKVISHGYKAFQTKKKTGSYYDDLLGKVFQIKEITNVSTDLIMFNSVQGFSLDITETALNNLLPGIYRIYSINKDKLSYTIECDKLPDDTKMPSLDTVFTDLPDSMPLRIEKAHFFRDFYDTYKGFVNPVYLNDIHDFLFDLRINILSIAIKSEKSPVCFLTERLKYILMPLRY